jgi:isopenicillin-N N-acyltransferase like protein
MPFPYVEASGTPYQMGFQHGRQAAAPIGGFLDYLVRMSHGSLTGAEAPEAARGRVLEAARRFLPLFEQHCPALLEEIRGVADGAGIRFEEALLLQIRGEAIPLLREEACTTFAVSGRHTTSEGALIGQTSDMEPELEQFFIVLRLAPDDGPRLLMWTFAGQVGYHGLSRHGVAHFANSIPGGPASPRGLPGGLPHYPVKRRLYECRSREEVLRMWDALPVCSSGNYMMAAAGELFDVEATPAGPALLEDREQGFLVHTNHFLSPRFRTADTDAAAMRDSFPRQERMTALIRERLDRIDVEGMKTALSDHHNHPCGVCRHEESGTRRMATVSGLIAEPEAGRLHVSRGNPCRGDWSCYEV